MARNRLRIQGGVQWRRNLRNIPARQAAAVAAAAAAKQPAAVIPPPPPFPPIRPPPQPIVVNRNRGRARGRAKGRARGRVRPIPVGRRPLVAAAGGHGEKNIDNAFIRNRGRYKIKRFLPVPRNVQVRRRGAVVRRMIGRRRAIYPARRQQREY